MIELYNGLKCGEMKDIDGDSWVEKNDEKWSKGYIGSEPVCDIFSGEIREYLEDEYCGKDDGNEQEIDGYKISTRYFGEVLCEYKNLLDTRPFGDLVIKREKEFRVESGGNFLGGATACEFVVSMDKIYYIGEGILIAIGTEDIVLIKLGDNFIDMDDIHIHSHNDKIDICGVEMYGMPFTADKVSIGVKLYDENNCVVKYRIEIDIKEFVCRIYEGFVEGDWRMVVDELEEGRIKYGKYKK